MTTTPHAELLTDDIRELQKWLNEDPNRPLDRPALSRVCAALLARLGEQQPIDMVLHCPACGLHHIDAPEPTPLTRFGFENPFVEPWGNPPHRSHKCHGCGHIWRPADVPTNGVAAVKTKGKADSPVVHPSPTPVGAQEKDFSK